MSFPPEHDEREPYSCLAMLAASIFLSMLSLFALGKLLVALFR